MKVIAIALKDLTSSFRSAFAIVFMFGIPLLVTGMFYFMFGNSSSGNLQLPKTTVIVANLDEGGRAFNQREEFSWRQETRTLGEMVVNVLESDELADLVQVSTVSSGEAARAVVDGQKAQVAIIIPPDFSKKFADANKQSTIEFYQDPTLTIGPEIIRSILNRFMDGLAGVKIALNVYLDEASPNDAKLAGQVIQQYLDSSLVQTKDLAAALLDTRSSTAAAAPKRDDSLLSQIVGPIMAGMLIFYAFFYRYVYCPIDSQRRRRAHAAANVHHADSASSYLEWEVSLGLSDGVGAGDGAARGGALDLPYSVG